MDLGCITPIYAIIIKVEGGDCFPYYCVLKHYGEEKIS